MLDRMDTVDRFIDTQKVIIDCRKVDFMDLTAIFTLDAMVERLLQHGIKVSVVTTPANKNQLVELNTAYLSESRLFTSLKSAQH
ncbi:MAG: STAS domain-containing protein [Nitrincola sp.]|nr:STAS domain-containing protein [Nitrincola sp.]